MFQINPLLRSDGYKIGHPFMLAPGTTRLYGTWIPRTVKYAPGGIRKILSAGHQLTWKQTHDEWEEGFFKLSKEDAVNVVAKDFCGYLGLPYDASHFEELYDLGYLPVKVKALPEGIETLPNIPHMTFINTVDGFAWLPLYLETSVSSMAWKTSTSATIALQYRRNVEKWVNKTDPSQSFLIPFLCHDFSARGLSPWDSVSSGLGHAMSFRGSDTLAVIPAARYFYNESKDEVCINSVNASEHSVSTTKIFTVGERQMIIDWLKLLPEGIFSMVCDTFSTWQFIDYLKDPEIKKLVLERNGKLVVRPDSGDPVDIICGLNSKSNTEEYLRNKLDTDQKISDYAGQPLDAVKGVIELLWDIFGGTINEQGYKVLDPHIGAIYGDSINLERQIAIYERLAAKGFAATNIVLGVGSFTYQFNTRDTFGFAAKGAWFEVKEYDIKGSLNSASTPINYVGYDIYKDPVTDDGSKKSLKGRCAVFQDENGEYFVKTQCTTEQEEQGFLQVIYEDGKFYNQTTLTEIREKINKLI